jgi:hypothetical protein
VCAHFVDRATLKLAKGLIGLPSIVSHSASVQLDALWPLLEDYGITRKIGAVIGDNASVNDKLCAELSVKLGNVGITWDVANNRMRCNGHIINLAVQAFLFQELEATRDDDQGHDVDCRRDDKLRKTFRGFGPLGKLHNIVVHIRGSPARLKQFEGLAGRLIPLDNNTRWNSWYEMLEVAIHKESAVDGYAKSWFNSLTEDYLLPADWECLRKVYAILQPFFRATKATEGDEATVDRVLFTMDVLVAHFRKCSKDHQADDFLYPRITKSWAVFDKYYLKTDDSAYYAAAIIFHPGRKVGYLRRNWDKAWVKSALQAVKDLWDVFKAEAEAGTTPVVSGARRLTISGGDEDLDAFDRLAQGLDDIPRSAGGDEYKEYSEEPAIRTSSSPLQWWLEDSQQERWPTLARLACNVLSIPAMSAEPERVFSGARRTISWERMRLGQETIEMVECLKHWQRSGLTEDV